MSSLSRPVLLGPDGEDVNPSRRGFLKGIGLAPIAAGALLLPGAALAANNIYNNPGSTVTFKASGGTVVFTPQNVASAAGRISAQWDRGSGAQPGVYRWRAKTKAGSALTVGNVLEIYLATSDGTVEDGNLSTSDAAFASADKRRNLQPVGTIVADSTTNGEPQQASGTVEIFERYVSVVWWNALGQTLTNTAGDHEFDLTPWPPQVQ